MNRETASEYRYCDDRQQQAALGDDDATSSPEHLERLRRDTGNSRSPATPNLDRGF